MTYSAAKRKLWLEKVIMYPFVFLGKIAGHFFKLRTKHHVFLFCPNGDIGGSPQVNIDLANCIKDQKPLVIFSKKPNNDLFREKYNIDGVQVIDLHKYIDNKAFHFINFFFRGILATWINKQENAVIVGGESLFFYKVIPHIKKDARCVEICHLDTWLPYSIGFIDRINYRVFSTNKLKEKVEDQYRQNNLPEKYFSRLFFYDNAIDIPELVSTDTNELQVYFIGRGAPQKRVHLTVAIAEKVYDKGLPVKFNFVGDVEKIIAPADYPYCNFFGNIKDQEQMKQIYEKADVLLMTSSFEGLPVVIMQMMAHGKVVVSTAVNAIPDYIHHKENGLLIYSTDETSIIKEGCMSIEYLLEHPELRKLMGEKSRLIAIEKFGRQVFCSNYRKLLNV